MNSTVDIPPVQEMDAEAFDVIIIGAGLSGIGTAVRLQRDCPDRDFILLERRDAIGGTWDLFRYPGIRSDSDMHTRQSHIQIAPYVAAPLYTVFKRPVSPKRRCDAACKKSASLGILTTGFDGLWWRQCANGAR